VVTGTSRVLCCLGPGHPSLSFSWADGPSAIWLASRMVISSMSDRDPWLWPALPSGMEEVPSALPLDGCSDVTSSNPFRRNDHSAMIPGRRSGSGNRAPQDRVLRRQCACSDGFTGPIHSESEIEPDGIF